MRKSPALPKIIKGALFYLMLCVIVAVTILPFLWMISSSFKGSEAIRTIPIRWIPERPTLEGYQRVFNMQGFSFTRATLNSLVLAIACTVVAVGSASMAAFVLFDNMPSGVRIALVVLVGVLMLATFLGYLKTYLGARKELPVKE